MRDSIRMRVFLSFFRAALAVLSFWLEISLALFSCGDRTAGEGRRGAGGSRGRFRRSAYFGLVGLF